MDDEVSRRVIGAAFTVHNVLGFGFLETVYERALGIELDKIKIPYVRQSPIRVYYDGRVVGEFVPDMLVDGHLLVELKSVSAIVTAHEVQLVNYHTATGIDSGLLINFGPSKVDVRRKYRTYKP